MHAEISRDPNESIQSSWNVVETLTVTMKIAAETQQWFDVVEQATTRHNLLLQHFEHYPIGPQNADFYRERLHVMLQGEQDLQTLVRNARKALMSEGQAMQLNKRMVGAYLNASMS